VNQHAKYPGHEEGHLTYMKYASVMSKCSLKKKVTFGRMQVCTSLQTDNHASTPPFSFLQVKCPSCHPTYSIKALKARRRLHTHTHTRLTALCPGLPGLSRYQKGKPIWILLKQETVSGSGISWAACKSAPCSRQITTPASHHSVFYRPNALPVTQPTASKH